MKFPPWLPVYGDQTFRGECPKESFEQKLFFRILRAKNASLGALALHVRNEGFRMHAQTRQWQSEGMVAGAPDIIVPGHPSFLCEMKRLDHTQSTWRKGQLDYLFAARSIGAHVCVALGGEAALIALSEWEALYILMATSAA
jgi:hypothetical protein